MISSQIFERFFGIFHVVKAFWDWPMKSAGVQDWHIHHTPLFCSRYLRPLSIVKKKIWPFEHLKIPHSTDIINSLGNFHHNLWSHRKSDFYKTQKKCSIENVIIDSASSKVAWIGHGNRDHATFSNRWRLERFTT